MIVAIPIPDGIPGTAVPVVQWVIDFDRCEAPVELAAKEMGVTPDVIRNIAGPDGYNQRGIANYEGYEFVYADGD